MTLMIASEEIYFYAKQNYAIIEIIYTFNDSCAGYESV